MGVNGIYGLSGSGLDIESMVKVGMMSKQNEYDKMAQKYTTNEWKKNALVELNNQITTFNMSSLTDYKLSSSTNARTAESSNEAVVKATANSTAPLMSHRISVNNLSANAYLISDGKISNVINNNGGDTSKVLLKDILFQNLTEGSTKVTSTYNAKTTGTGDFSGYDVYSATGTLTKTGVKIDANSISVKYQSTEGEISSTFYDSVANLTLGSPTSSSSTLTTTKSTAYTSGSSTITLEKIDVSNTNNSGATTTDSIKYKINGTEFTLSSITTDTDPNNSSNTITANEYTSADSLTSFKISTNSDGSVTISRGTRNNTTDDFSYDTATSYTAGTEQTSSVKVEDFTYSNNETKKVITTTDVNGKITENSTLKYNSGSAKLVSTKVTDGNTVTEKETLTYSGGATKTTSKTTTNGTVKADSTTININGRTITTNNLNRSATTVAYESGITGNTLNSYNTNTNELTGARSNVSSGFTEGKHRTVDRDDVALAFTIGDGKNETTISLKYDDILGNADNAAMTLNDLVSKINTGFKENGVTIKAAYDNVYDRLTFYNTEAKKDSVITITALGNNNVTDGSYNYAGQITTNFLNALGFQNFDGDNSLENRFVFSGAGGDSKTREGTYGSVTIDGVLYDKVEDNKITVAGVTYNLLSKTTDATGTNRPETVTVGQDVDGIIGKVKSFVESYNKILGSLYEKYSEKPESGYTPLTQTQKDQMKDEQIEKWEEKAKKGLLYHDSTLSKIINDMRNAITASVEVDGKNYSVFGIGIGTTGIQGQLTLDEEKLRKAINEDGDVVYNTISKLTTKIDSTTGKEVTDYDKSGVAQRLGDVFSNATKLLKSRAGSSTDITEDSDLNNLLRELQTKMSNFKKMMNAFEDKLYKKYDAMEVALSKLGMQLNFITGGQ